MEQNTLAMLMDKQERIPFDTCGEHLTNFPIRQKTARPAV